MMQSKASFTCVTFEGKWEGCLAACGSDSFIFYFFFISLTVK